jgi:hypothetical protein
MQTAAVKYNEIAYLVYTCLYLRQSNCSY